MFIGRKLLVRLGYRRRRPYSGARSLRDNSKATDFARCVDGKNERGC